MFCWDDSLCPNAKSFGITLQTETRAFSRPMIFRKQQNGPLLSQRYALRCARQGRRKRRNHGGRWHGQGARRAYFTIALFGAPAIAGQITVGDLHEICSGTDYESRAACRFYILGVTEGAGLGAAVAKAPAGFCIAPDLSSVALMEAVEKAIKDDLTLFPKDRDLAASGFIGTVVKDSFPCRE